MADQDVWLQIEPIDDYNPINKGVDCMRNSGHEQGTIPDNEIRARKVTAVVYREYTDQYYINKKPDKLIITDINEPKVEKRIGTIIYTMPGTRLKIHVRNADHEPHSFHIHGISYGIDSDGAWPFGTTNQFGQRSDEICHDEIWTYTFDVTPDMIGAWPFHDHYKNIMESVNLGLFGGIIVVPDLIEPWIPPPFQLPQAFTNALDNTTDPIVTRREMEPFIMEMLEVSSSQPQIGPNDIIHAPILFHVLGAEKMTPIFDTGIILPNTSVTKMLNLPNNTDLYYHCKIHPFMFGVIKFRDNSNNSSVNINIKDSPMRFEDNEVTVKSDFPVNIQWTNQSASNHTATEGGIPSFCFNGRTFVGNTPTIEASQGQTIRFYVFNLDLGMDWHNFHTHAMRWKMPTLKFNIIITNNDDIVREDVRSIGPAESFALDVEAPPVMLFDDPQIEIQQPNPPPNPPGDDWDWFDIKGDFLFHCHVEPHMSQGLAGLVRVKRKIWLYKETQLKDILKTTGLPNYDPNQPIGCPQIADLNRCESITLGKWEFINGLTEQDSLPGITMMHAILIPKTNKVLFWGYYDTASNGQRRTRILDIANSQTPYADTANFPHEVVPFSGDDAINCANIWSAEHTFLDTNEGTILVNGGFAGMWVQNNENYYNRQTFLFHPDNQLAPWEFLGGNDPNNLQNLTIDGRFYSTTITLDDGRAITLLGDFQNGTVHLVSFSLEIFDINSISPNKWVQRIPINSDTWPGYKYYPWTYQLPDGDLFISGPKARTIKFNYQTPDNFTEFTGAAGDRDFDDSNQEGTSCLLPLRPSDNYAVKIVIAGGETTQTMNSLQMINLSQINAAWSTLTPLEYARKIQTDSVILADGTILFCGGAVDSQGNQIPGKSEIYDPESGELKAVASNLLARGYHSAALLLIDGTVVLGGDRNGDRLGAGMKCERYKPPYFFKQRPVISSNNFPQLINFGVNFTIEIEDDPNDIIEAAIIRPGAVTHGWNMTQRYIELSITNRLTNPNRLQIDPPPGGNVAPPGWYFLVILKGGTCGTDECGKIPSIGKWFRLA